MPALVGARIGPEAQLIKKGININQAANNGLLVIVFPPSGKGIRGKSKPAYSNNRPYRFIE
jgi:hypothetical protein